MEDEAIGDRKISQEVLPEAWGWLTSLDVKGCDPDIIRDADRIRSYVVQLCDLIEMKRFQECHIVNFGEEERVAGFSMFQFIETSSLQGHFANMTNEAFIDVFSCKAYDPAVVSAFTLDFFKGSEVKMTTIPRGVRESSS